MAHVLKHDYVFNSNVDFWGACCLLYETNVVDVVQWYEVKQSGVVMYNSSDDVELVQRGFVHTMPFSISYSTDDPLFINMMQQLRNTQGN